MFSLYILYLYFHCYCVIHQTYISFFFANNFNVLMIDEPSKGWWLKRLLWIKLIPIKNTSRVNVLNFLNVILLSKWCHLMTLWMLIIIKRVFWSCHSIGKNVKSFSKGPFLSHFLYFPSCYKLTMECQISIIFPWFWYRDLW